MKYSLVLHRDKDSGYGVSMPDVPGCFSAGATVEEALENAHEALALHFEGLLADQLELPQPKPVDLHLDNPDYAAGVWAVIDFDVTPFLGKSVRFNATLPERLLLRIDDRVQKDHRYSSRSGFLAAAALRELSG